MDIPVNIDRVRLEAPPLLLRPFCEEDAADFFAYASVPGVGEAAGWRHHTDPTESLAILRGFIRDGNVFAIEADGHVIGSVGLHTPWTEGVPSLMHLRAKEIGYVLSKDYWGRGLMCLAVEAVINYCFDELKADAVAVTHFAHNDRSRRVIEKCGFQYVDASFLEARQLGRGFRTLRYLRYSPHYKK